MADSLGRHHGCALVDRRIGRAGRDGCRHDPGDRRGHRIEALSDDPAQDVALGEDPGQPPATRDHEPSDAALAHQLGSAEHRFMWRDGDDAAALLGEDIADGRHGATSGRGPNRYYGAAARCASRREPTLSPGLRAVSLGRLWHFTRGVLYDGARHYQ